MSHDIKGHLAELLQAALKSVAPDHAATPIVLERPKQESHGDFAANVAMQLARALKKNPREIAQQLVNELPASSWVEKVDIAGAGFINFTLKAAAKTAVVEAVLTRGGNFGRSTAGGQQKVQVEYVSANPTGPLHVGHGRGAAYGASLSCLLAYAGWDVTQEYYVNDAGRQMDILAVSTWLRYLESFGETLAFPPNGYQGDYVRTMAGQIKAAHGDKYLRPAKDVYADAPSVDLDKEVHLDALIAKAKDLLGPDWSYIHQHALS